MRLSELEPGESANVLQVTGSGIFRLRLMELGLTPGVKIRRVEDIYSADPMVFRVREAALSIRRDDASQVVVVLDS
jgi:Fe2+ transport system protein FeoA